MLLASGVVLRRRYRIVKVLGQGGFGAVYLAEDIRLANRPVAVKEALGTKKEDRQRAEQEADLMARLSHPNLAQVLDTFGESNNTYVVMQYVEGHDLMEETEVAVKASAPLRMEKVLEWIEQACAALAYLHQQDIVHRDVKPHNLRLKPDGTVVLIDLGIAKRGANMQTGRLQKGFTPVFAPPEQQVMSASTNRASDVYALGMTMYMMLTGQVPPDALERTGDPPRTPPKLLIPPSVFNSKIPPQLEHIILKATELSSTRRYKDAGEMLAAIRAFRAGSSPTPARATPPIPVRAGTAQGYTPKFCPNCGKRNSTQAKFCVQCGKRIARLAVAGAIALPGNVAGSFHQPLPSTTTPPEQYAADGDVFYKARRYEDAVTAYERARRSGYTTAEMEVRLARCYFMAGRVNDVVDALKGLLAAPMPAVTKAATTGLFARVAYLAGEKQTARDNANAALRLDSAAGDACFVMGELEFDNKQYAAAMKWLQRAAAVDPNDFHAWHMLGVTQLLNRDERAGIRSLETAIALEPHAVSPRLLIAFAARDMGDRQRARQEVQTVLRIDPRNQDALDLLANL
jgi:Tfp pilus assembly protein PilF